MHLRNINYIHLVYFARKSLKYIHYLNTYLYSKHKLEKSIFANVICSSNKTLRAVNLGYMHRIVYTSSTH